MFHAIVNGMLEGNFSFAILLVGIAQLGAMLWNNKKRGDIKMSDIYKPEQLKEDAAQKKLMVDTAVDVQCALQILIEKGIMTKEELDTWRTRVRNMPKYKASYEMIQKLLEAADLYDKDPKAYLRAIMEAKLNGTLK